ncbi:MAG: 3-dehydroquinate synthase [Clostridia bacterium]|nr:3-dehydroquinate synthase [Clostridia bacterium]
MNIYKTIHLSLEGGGYDITVGRDLLAHADEFFNLNRRVLIVTDTGVPREYSQKICERCRECRIFTFEAGEERKNLRTLEEIFTEMLDFGMQRGDCVVAVGGGVSGDMAGFAAACYMRGVDFYNVPTTLLSQVDSSIGGKTAVDFGGAKNIIGAFYQPSAVLIDTDVLKTLDDRQISAGLSEVIKMSLTSDAELFALLEEKELNDNICQIIVAALEIKRRVVEADVREGGIRKILNFGHTLGHAIEACGGLLHGECVALGMIPMVSDGVKERLIKVLRKYSLPTSHSYDRKQALHYLVSDKKGNGDAVDAIYVDEVGQFVIRRTPFRELAKLL